MEVKQQIDSIFSLWQQGLCPGGQVLVRHKGQVIYEQCFGYANLEHGVKITPDTVFHVASVSKQITVLCMLLLVEQGKVKLEQDIREFAPELIAFEEPVTLCQLMNNVSGIRDQWELLMMRGVRIDDTITMQDLKTMISLQTALNFAPGSQYLYSNSNFTLIAQVVEAVSGQSLQEFAQAHIFAPLGMGSTCIKEHFSQVIANRAYSYDDNGQGEFCYHPINYAAYGATSLHTKAGDFIKVLENYRNPSICTADTLAKMMERPYLADGSQSIYGGGLMMGQYKGKDYLEHGGVDAAYRAHAMRFPGEDLDIVIFSNTQNTIPALAARQVADLVLNLPAQAADHAKYLVEDHKPGGEEGIYLATSPTPLKLEICRRGGQLVLGSGMHGPVLHHLQGNCYQVGYLNDKLYLGDTSAAYQMGANLYPLHRADTCPRETDSLLAYEGAYESAELDTNYYMEEQDGHLWASHVRYGRSMLLPLGKDSFLLQMEHLTMTLRFTRGSGNRVIGFVADGGRVLHMGFSKKD